MKLLAICLGNEIPRTQEFWEWKHEKNPFGTSPALVADHDGQLVGLRTFLRWAWQSGSTPISAARAVDTVTHPDWQGRNIFRTLTTTLLEDLRNQQVAFIFNTPNRFSLPGYLKMGWQPVTRVPLWFRPLRPFRSVLGLIGSHPRIIEQETSSISSVLEKPSIEQCLQSVLRDVRMHTNRSIPYLKWRYSDIPGFRYFARFHRDAEDSALLIYRLRTRGKFIELSLSEVLVTESNKGIEIGRTLLKEILRDSNADYAIGIAATNTPEKNVLKRAGFFPLGKFGPIVTVKQLNDLPFHVFDWSNWRCSIGDLEIF
jgi:GNAT superfamily N-acetyltransferase